MLQISVVESVPFLIIDAVQNPHQCIGSLTQHSIEAAAKRRRSNFTRISGAYSGDNIRVSDAGFQAVHISEEFHTVEAKIIQRKVSETIRAAGKVSLESQVVDGEAGSRQVRPPFSQPLMLHQKRHDGDLPIMHMNHFG